MTIDISVVVPFYGREWRDYLLLFYGVSHFFNVPNAEVVIVDDGSPTPITKCLPFSRFVADANKIRPTSRPVTKEEGPSNDRVTLLVEPINRGVGYSRNEGIAWSSGRFILLKDHDIFVSNPLLEQMLQTLKTTGADLVCINYVRDATGTRWSDLEAKFWEYNETQGPKTWLSCGCMLVRRFIFEFMQFPQGDEDTLFSRAIHASPFRAETLPVTARHFFSAGLRGLWYKWFYGGRRVAVSQTRTRRQVVATAVKAPGFAVKLARHFRDPGLVPFILVRTLGYMLGFLSGRPRK